MAHSTHGVILALDQSGVRRIRIGVLALFSLFIMLSSASLSSFGAVPEDLFSGVTTLVAPYAANPNIDVDGVVSAGEYDPNVTYQTGDTGISVSMIHDNDSLFVALTGPTWSWVAIGFSSDNATTMGFVLVARGTSGYDAQERLVTAVSDNMVFTANEPDHHAAIDEFQATVSGGNTTAELKLSLSASIWTLQTGTIYPSVIASNLTAPQGFPTAMSGDEIHFVGSYLLRSFDDLRNINDTLNGKISPVASIVAAAVLSVGIVAIFAEFVVRRRPR